MYQNFRNHNLRRERRETGSAAWGPVQSKQFPCGYFTLLRGGINPIWKLSENYGICSVLSSHYDTSAAPVAQDQLYSIYGKF